MSIDFTNLEEHQDVCLCPRCGDNQVVDTGGVDDHGNTISEDCPCVTIEGKQYLLIQRLKEVNQLVELINEQVQKELQ